MYDKLIINIIIHVNKYYNYIESCKSIEMYI